MQINTGDYSFQAISMTRIVRRVRILFDIDLRVICESVMDVENNLRYFPAKFRYEAWLI